MLLLSLSLILIYRALDISNRLHTLPTMFSVNPELIMDIENNSHFDLHYKTKPLTLTHNKLTHQKSPKGESDRYLFPFRSPHYFGTCVPIKI